MSFLDSMKSRYAGNPKMLLVAVVGFSLSFFIGYRNFFSPWLTEKRYQEANKYAEFLFEKETKMIDKKNN